MGFANLTMGLLAERVGVRTPSLYKHVGGQEDLNRRIAALATDLGFQYGAGDENRTRTLDRS